MGSSHHTFSGLESSKGPVSEQGVRLYARWIQVNVTKKKDAARVPILQFLTITFSLFNGCKLLRVLGVFFYLSRLAFLMVPGGRIPMEMMVFTFWEDCIFCLDPFHPALREPNHSNWFLVTISWGSPSMHPDGQRVR